jgi:hypothetical protein
MRNSISTPFKPLSFFEVFLAKNNFDKFTDDFFTNNDNPTFYADIKNGFIEYTDIIYEKDEPIVPRVIYFKDYLLNIIEPQISNSINMIKSKIEEIEINGNNPHNYVQKLRTSYIAIRKEITKNNSYKDLILPQFEKIESVIRLSDFDRTPNLISQMANGDYFKPNIKESKLKKIYKIARSNEIIDAAIVSETQFLNVFNCSNPKNIVDKIIFNSNNRQGLFFLNCMSKYFSNLKPSSIAQSQLFLSKKGTVLKQNNIDTINSFFKKNKIAYPEIIESFDKLGI